MPFFLWLLPFTAIPLIIHLLNQRNVITIEFSTLQFLTILEKESIRKLKLLQFILLIIRTIIILLIIFMITRPVFTGSFPLKYSGESALHAILLDDSFSMQGNSSLIQIATASILKQIPNKGQLIWVNINKGVMYKGLKEDMPPLINFLSFTHLGGSITDGLNVLNQNIDNDYSSKEVYILTDLQFESMKDLWEHEDQYQDMHLYTMVIPKLDDNLIITNVELLSKLLLPNHTIDINVSIKNGGNIDKENILLQLIIDDISVGQQLVSIRAEQQQTFLFKTALSKRGIHRAMVALETDDRDVDNRYYFNLHIPDKNYIALIGNSEDSYYIRKSMEALNKFGESLIINKFLSLYDPTLKLSNYDAIFIITPSILSNVNDSKVEEYLYNGGHIIIFPGFNSKPWDYSILNSLSLDISGNYKNLSINELSGNSFQGIDISSIQIGEIYNLFLSATGNDRKIRIFQYFPLPYNPEFSQLLLNDGSNVWNRYNIHSGIIDIFGFAMNLKWSNLPIKGTFLPFIHYIAYSNISDKQNIFQGVGHQWKVIPEDYYTSTIYHFLPDGSRKIINSDENNHLITDILEYPGYHSIQTGERLISQIAINSDKSELNCNYTSIKSLKRTVPSNMQIIPMESDILTEIKQARIGTEIWSYILYLSIFLILVEMLISNAKKPN